MKINYFMLLSDVAKRKDLSSTEKLVFGLISTLEKNRMSQREMANQLGLNVAQINRAIKKLKSENLILVGPTKKRIEESFKKGGIPIEEIPPSEFGYISALGQMPFKQLQDHYNEKFKNSQEIIPDPEIKKILDMVYVKKKRV